MNEANDGHTPLISVYIKDPELYFTVDDNPVARYAFFCNHYNQSCNIVEGKVFETPDLNSRGYRLYRYSWEWWRNYFSCVQDDIDCDSLCCLPKALLRFFVLIILPSSVPVLTIFSLIFYLIPALCNNEDCQISLKGNYLNAFWILLPTVMGYLYAVLCTGYTICYMMKFTRLVDRNFIHVPRALVLSNMIYVPNLTREY